MREMGIHETGHQDGNPFPPMRMSHGLQLMGLPWPGRIGKPDVLRRRSFYG